MLKKNQPWVMKVKVSLVHCMWRRIKQSFRPAFQEHDEKIRNNSAKKRNIGHELDANE